MITDFKFKLYCIFRFFLFGEDCLWIITALYSICSSIQDETYINYIPIFNAIMMG